VSRAAGAPYRDKLLRLPAFLIDASAAMAPDDLPDGLALTGFFLERHVFAPLGRRLPPARVRFVERVASATISGMVLSTPSN
jgi:DNA repair protein RecO (recombination protein O)